MIKFFRRIRRKLIDEGNLKRYLIYAVGEVLLVMIGILLALQVNNWNEKRKNRSAEIEALEVIQANLHEERKRLEIVVGFKEGDIIIMQHLLSGNFDSIDIVNIYYPLTGWHSHLPCNTGYKALVENNNISLISNKKLLNELIYFYEVFYSFLSNWGIDDNNFAQTKMVPYLLEKLPSEPDRYDIKAILNHELNEIYFRNLVIKKMELFEAYKNVIRNRAFKHIDNLILLLEEELAK